jgi:predicted dithiol-disulfide oxidoreductase (DUF899 family)
MPDHKIGTREEWQAAREKLAKAEAEHAELGQKVVEGRRQLPWVPVEKEYRFDTDNGKKTLAELFDGRSQLLAYNIMFGPDYELGACPGCSNLGDELDGTRVHLNHRDVTLVCFSRAPVDRLVAYKKRMGWQFPTSRPTTEFPFDFAALAPEQARGSPVKRWSTTRRSGSRSGVDRSEPSSRTAYARPELDRFRAGERARSHTRWRHQIRSSRPTTSLLERTPKAGAEEPPPRKDSTRLTQLVRRSSTRRHLSETDDLGIAGEQDEDRAMAVVTLSPSSSRSSARAWLVTRFAGVVISREPTSARAGAVKYGTSLVTLPASGRELRPSPGSRCADVESAGFPRPCAVSATSTAPRQLAVLVGLNAIVVPRSQNCAIARHRATPTPRAGSSAMTYSIEVRQPIQLKLPRLTSPDRCTSQVRQVFQVLQVGHNLP